jgi:hypothetical protein
VLLNAATQASNKTRVAERVGVSRSAISLLLSNRYPSKSLARIEGKVLAALDNINCPVLGTLENSECQKNRELPFSSANPQRINLYRACQHCPNNPNNQESAA